MATLQQTCKSCGNVFSGKFCNHCGEKIYSDHDKSFGHILEEGFHFITHFEGTFLVTLKTILFHPGKLSEDYTFGIRKKYFKPLSFFLLLVVLYLLFPMLRGLNMNLNDHLGNFWYGKFATEKIEAIAAAHNWSPEKVTEKFEAVSGKVSKFLLFIIIPLMAGFCWLVIRKKQKVLFDHFIFATEMASFFLLWGFLIMPLFLYPLIRLSEALGWGFIFEGETLTVIFLVAPFIVYVAKAARRFYEFPKGRAILFSLAYSAVLLLFVLSVYKILLFYFTAWFLH